MSDVQCANCGQWVSITGKQSKAGPGKVSHHYGWDGVCSGTYGEVTSEMRAEGEAREARAREAWQQTLREQEEQRAAAACEEQARIDAKRAMKAAARDPARLRVASACLSMLDGSLREMERGGALTADEYDLHLATMTRWVNGEGTSKSLDETGAWLYSNRNRWRCEPDEQDEGVRFNVACMSSIAWSMWSLSSFIRARHNGDVLTKCRMTLATVLARFGEDPHAAAGRAKAMEPTR